MTVGTEVDGRYRIVEELGRSEASVTYLAQDAQTGRPCVAQCMSLRQVDSART